MHGISVLKVIYYGVFLGLQLIKQKFVATMYSTTQSFIPLTCGCGGRDNVVNEVLGVYVGN